MCWLTPDDLATRATGTERKTDYVAKTVESASLCARSALPQPKKCEVTHSLCEIRTKCSTLCRFRRPQPRQDHVRPAISAGSAMLRRARSTALPTDTAP